MQERAISINATVDIKSQPDRGTIISVLWQDDQGGGKNGTISDN